MPYYLYKVFSDKRFDLIEEHQEYRIARDKARDLRTDAPSEDVYIIKMIFAKDTAQAEHLLKQKREPRAMGEDA